MGELVLDVSYGGNFYAIVDVQKNFKGLENYSADKLIAWARELRKNINAKYEFVHPEDPTINGAHIFYGREQLWIKLLQQEMLCFMEIKPLTVHPAAPGHQQEWRNGMQKDN